MGRRRVGGENCRRKFFMKGKTINKEINNLCHILMSIEWYNKFGSPEVDSKGNFPLS